MKIHKFAICNLKYKINKGNILIIVSLLILVFLILIPMLIFHVSHESKWTLREKRTSIAFQLAEAGIDRAIWKLREKDTYWTDVGNGIPIPGYNFDTTYADIPNTSNPVGEYKIKIEKHPTDSSCRRITAIGRDKSKNEIRAIQVDVTKTIISSAVSTGVRQEWKPNLLVHWGPVVSYDEIVLEGAQVNTYWPVKYSAGKIDPWDTDPNPPNDDGTEYSRFYSFVNLGPKPQIDLDYYRNKAKATTGIPNPKQGGPADPPGSGYFPGTKDVVFSKAENSVNNKNAVIFVENADVRLEDSASSRLTMVVEAFVVAKGNIHIHSNGIDNYVVNVPSEAWKQYQKGTVVNGTVGDSAAKNEYPGDDGYRKCASQITLSNVAFHGLLYTYNFKCSAGINNVIGVVIVENEMQVNTMTIYYDRNIGDSVKLSSAPIRIVSWKEIKMPWP
jgi:hypothetical protein